jgi:ABC-type transporter Mla subunit MlaD
VSIVAADAVNNRRAGVLAAWRSLAMQTSIASEESAMSSTLPDEAAFRDIFDQHRALRELLERIGAMLRQRTASIDQVAELLGQLGDTLIKHFTHEEAGGYYGDALLHAPRLVGRANDLLAQHPKMARNVRQLVEIAPLGDTGVSWWDETQTRFDAFVQELLDHERREDSLIQEAYIRDVAASD